MKRYITEVSGAPKAVGPYSPAVIANGFAFLSGQIPIDPETGKLCGSGIEEQTDQVMKNIKAVLSELKLEFSDIVKTTIFLSDLGNFQTVNAIYARWLGDVRPARSTIQVAALPLGSLVEIECLAMLR